MRGTRRPVAGLVVAGHGPGKWKLAQLPIYVINLDRRPDRWKTLSARLDRLGIEATRIPAVDARQLAGMEGAQSRPRIVAAIANMQSQAKALRLFLQTDHPAALILEDDAVLASDTSSLLESVVWWPAGCDIVRLETGYHEHRALYPSCGRTPTGRELRRVGKWIGGAAAYMVNRRGANLVIRAFEDPIRTTDATRSVDHTLFDLPVSRIARQLNPAQIVPAMAHQDGSPSDYDEWRNRARLSGWQRLRWIAKGLPFRILNYWPLRAFGTIKHVELEYSDTPPVA